MSGSDKTGKSGSGAETGKGSGSGAGYGQPPRSSQFKKGQSGNPNGRPRQVAIPFEDRSAAALTLREAERLISVRDGEGVRQMTQIEAILRTQYLSASKGSAYAQKNIIERYERADRERRVALEANNELWRGYVREQRQEIALAAKNGTETPLFLPHPDDVVIDPDRGVIFRGPYDDESLQRTLENCDLRDAMLIQHVFNNREEGIKTTGPTTALFCALELNRLSPKRFQLPDLTLTRTLLRLGQTTKRELKRLLKAAWGLLGRDPPAPSKLTPARGVPGLFTCTLGCVLRIGWYCG